MMFSSIIHSLPASVLFSSLFLFLQGTSADQITSLSRAQTAFDILQSYYNQESGIWNSCGWWNGANCMTVIADLAALDAAIYPAAVDVFNNTFTVAPGVNPDPGVEKVSVAGKTQTLYPSLWPIPLPELHAKPGTVNASLWLDGYYDDDAWWALAWIAAYDITGNGDYLELAEGIFEGMVSYTLIISHQPLKFQI